jgi:hypothetical protein
LAIISVFLNAVLIKKLYFTSGNLIVNDSPIENPVEVVQVQLVSTVVPTASVRPYGTAEAVLKALETSTPILTFKPFNVYQDVEGKFHFPRTVSGSLEVGYLRYIIETLIEPKVVYSRQTFPLKAGILGILYDSDFKKRVDVNLIVPFTIPIIDQEIGFGVGIQSLTLTKGWTVYGNSEVICGIGRVHEGGSVGGVVGVAFKL